MVVHLANGEFFNGADENAFRVKMIMNFRSPERYKNEKSHLKEFLKLRTKLKNQEFFYANENYIIFSEKTC